MQVVAIVVSLVVTLVALPLIVKAVLEMLQVIRTGKPAIGRTDNPAKRTTNMLIETFGHTRMLQWHWVGILHWFAFAAFIVLSTAVAQAFFQLFKADFTWPIIGQFFLYEWIGEVLGLLGALAILPLIIYRQVKHRAVSSARAASSAHAWARRTSSRPWCSSRASRSCSSAALSTTWRRRTAASTPSTRLPSTSRSRSTSATCSRPVPTRSTRSRTSSTSSRWSRSSLR
ncbi:hypothetical protein [Aeromicrobium sp. UC242_57]|uniref:hypothetical protein n=1 Tax=Aeromicrobium sp. UC242_57 TaxID=3374624 RepID=UPI0037968ADF